MRAAMDPFLTGHAGGRPERHGSVEVSPYPQTKQHRALHPVVNPLFIYGNVIYNCLA